MDTQQSKTPDHDLLITLNTKVDQLSFDVKDLKTDVLTRIVRVEARLDANDVYHAGIPLQDLMETASWAKNIRSNLKFILIVTGFFFGLIGALADHLIQVWFKF